MIDVGELETLGWGTLTESERAAWLLRFAGNFPVVSSQNGFSLDGHLITKIDSNIVTLCESRLSEAVRQQYIENATAEASAIAYKGLTPAQVQNPSVALQFYWSLLTLPAEERARCMYWAVRGERA